MNTADDQGSIFPGGEKAPNEYFTGAAWVKILVQTDTIYKCQIGNVVFEPGARNNWHTHPGGQILIVTNGIGYYKEKDKPLQILRKGDVVKIPPDIVHWHGASPESEFTHIAINPNTERGIVVWLDPVKDDEYHNIQNKSPK